MGRNIWGRAAIAGNRVYFGCHDKKLHCLDIAGGATVWAADLAERTVARPLVYDGKIFVSCHEDYVYAFEQAGGKLLWKTNIGKEGSCTSALVVGSLVFFGAYDRQFRALDVRTGQVRWSLKSDTWFLSTPVLCGKEIAFSDSKKVYLADPKTGKVRLTITPGDKLNWNASAWGDRVYTGFNYDKAQSALGCFDRTTGRRLWTYACSWHNNGGRIVESDGICYFVGGGNLHAVRAKDGKGLWRRPLKRRLGKSHVWGTPVLAGKHIYVPGGRLHCVNMADGTIAWTFKGEFDAGPVLHDGRIYIGTMDKRFLCLEEDLDAALNLLADDKAEFGKSVQAGKLIRELGSDDWKIRDRATKALIGMGSSVLGEIRAIKTTDPEVEIRKQQILKAIGENDRSWSIILDAAAIRRLASVKNRESLGRLAKVLTKALGNEWRIKGGSDALLAGLKKYLAAHPALSIRVVVPYAERP